MSSGVQMFRIIPQLVPSSVDLKADHTHTLKITLRGKKTKGVNGAVANLQKSCAARVEQGSTGDTTPFCSTEQGKMLESILEALEKNAGSSSGPSAGQ
jgi:hypothetical protein